MILEAFAVRVHDQGGQVLHVAHLVLGAEADFVEWIPGYAALGGGRLKTQDFLPGVLLAPTRRKRPQFALQVRNDC